MGPWSLMLRATQSVSKRALEAVRGVCGGLFRGLTAPLTVYLVLLGNVYLFYAGVKKVRRARFASSVRFLEDLDEAGVQYLLNNLPAWLQSTEYERAQFLNEANRIMWPAYDTALSSVIRYELLPILRENAPSYISGLSFERLSLGQTPVTILGVKYVGPSFSSRLGFEVDLDIRWAGVPDIVMKLTPSRKWRLKKLTPVVPIRIQTVQLKGLMRLALEPLLPDLPFIGGCSVSFLKMPDFDFDLKLAGGRADVMSIPALSSWIKSSVLQGFFDGLIWPRKMEIPFMDEDEEQEGQLAGPAGLLTVHILEAELPETAGPRGHSPAPSSPYAAAILTSHCQASNWDIQAGFTEQQSQTLAPAWGEAFHLCVAEAGQVLKIFLADDDGQGKDALPRGRVDVPLTPLVEAAAPKKLMRLGSSAGIAMRARMAARRVRAQAAAKHEEEAKESKPGHTAEAPVAESEAAPDGDAQPSSDPQNRPEEATTRATSGQNALESSWIEAGDVLGGGPDSPGGDSPREGEQRGHWPESSRDGKTRSPKSPLGQGSSDWTLLGSSGSRDAQGSSATHETGDDSHGKSSESQQPPKMLAPIRTGVEKAEESQEAGPGPLSRSSSPGARRQLLSRGTSLARMRSGKLGLARLQSLPAKAARKTATQAALACQEPEGTWLPLLPMRPPAVSRKKKRSAASVAAASNAASSTSSELSEVVSNTGSEGSRYYPTLTKVNALLDTCADGPPSHLNVDQQIEQADRASATASTPASSGESQNQRPAAASPTSLSPFEFMSASSEQKPGVASEGRPQSSDAQSTPEDGHRSGAGNRSQAGEIPGGLPPTLSNLNQLLERAESGGRAYFANYKEWHRATAGLSRPAALRRATTRRSLYSRLFTAQGGAVGPQPGAHETERRPSVAGAVRVKLIFRPLTRTSKPLSTLPNPLPSQSQPAAKGSKTKAQPAQSWAQPSLDEQRAAQTAEQVIRRTPHIMGALVVLLQSVTLGGMRLQTPAIVLRLGTQVRRSQTCAAMHGGRTEWNLRATFALDLPADPCQVDHQLLVQVGEAPKMILPSWQKQARGAPPTSPTAWKQELQPTATCTIPLQSILDQGKAKGSWKMDLGQDDDKDTTSASGAVSLQFGWFPCT
ncbi:hypothetical protein WJX84_012217 [Apatococcus fuscideae]|uniref:SMP-LTD domain-containing protein n=1 Tax=Apatococcus fuscideae TaxID=2026836 RepID=A0AAW1T674_9CHLO